jgi:hypothetical protein
MDKTSPQYIEFAKTHDMTNAGAIAQFQVSQNGFNFDPTTGRPKVDTPAPVVTPFTETSGVISSKDDSAGFKADTSKLDGILVGMNGALNDAQILQLEKLGYKEGDIVPTKGRLMPDGTFDKTALTGTGTGNGGTGTGTNTSITGAEKPIDNTTATGSGDPIYDKMQVWQKEQDAKYEADAVIKRKAYEALYTTSLASIDATAQATINNINSTFDQRLTEQKRINQLRIDRMKAYGLGSGNAIYNPMEYTDSVSLREEEASTKIKTLDNERNSLIAQAKSARDSGASKLLRDKLGDLDKIDEQIRTQLQHVASEADKQYTLLKNIRKDEETKHKEAIAKMVERLTNIAPKYSDEYSKMDNTAKDAFIEQVVKETGLDYATVFATLNKSVSDAQAKLKTDAKDKLATDKATLDLETARNNLTKSKKELADGGKTQSQKEEDAMKTALPNAFTDKADAEAKRAQYVRDFGKKGAEYWDAVFYRADSKNNGEYNYTFGAPKTPAKPAKSPVQNTNGGTKSVEEAKKKYNINY